MRLVDLPGVFLGVVGVCALNGTVLGQGYPEGAGGYPGWGGSYPYAPRYEYEPGYIMPDYPAHPVYQPTQPPEAVHSGKTQPGGESEQGESPDASGVAGSPETEQAGWAAHRAAEERFYERRRAMQERWQALQAAIEQRHVESSGGQPPSANQRPIPPGDPSMQSGAAVEPTAPPSAESTAPGSGAASAGHLPRKTDPMRGAGAPPPVGLGIPRRPSLSERRAALEVRRQAIEQRRAVARAAVEERRRAALATTPSQPPTTGAIKPSSVVDEPGSGDADRGDVAGSVEKRRAAGDPAPMGLGLEATEPTEGASETAPAATAPAPAAKATPPEG